MAKQGGANKPAKAAPPPPKPAKPPTLQLGKVHAGADHTGTLNATNNGGGERR